MEVDSANQQVPKVSVGRPVYNGGQYLWTSIESILNQAYSDYEFIIVGNLFTDGTEEISREYAACGNVFSTTAMK